MAGHRRTLRVYSSRPLDGLGDAARLLAARHDVLVTADRGPALRDFLRRAHATVWIESTCGGPVQRVLAAIDPFAPHTSTSSVLEIADELHRAPHVELFVLHAWNAPGEMLVAYYQSALAARRYVVARHELATRAFGDCLQRTGLDVTARVCERGDVVEVIRRLADQLRIDAVVLGITPRSRLARALLGCTAERVARCVPCHVIVTKPPPGAPAKLPRAVALPRAA